MLSLSAKIRKELGKKVKTLRGKGGLPAILYGPGIKNLNLEIGEKEFEEIYQKAGESSIIKLKIKFEELRSSLVPAKASVNEKLKINEFLVLIHEVDRDPLTEKPIHVDFYQPRLEEEVEVTIPIIFEGEAPAVKDLGGTLVKNISELEIKALPQKLPHEIRVDISRLRTFEDNILVKDLIIPEEVKVLKKPDETIAFVAEPEKVEEELVKPIEEKVEEVEKVEEKPGKKENN